jgi:hypothetical protein
VLHAFFFSVSVSETMHMHKSTKIRSSLRCSDDATCIATYVVLCSVHIGAIIAQHVTRWSSHSHLYRGSIPRRSN